MNPVIGGTRKFLCGDLVCRIDDPRHIGRVTAIIGTNARVLWPPPLGERGAREDIDQDDLILIERKFWR